VPAGEAATILDDGRIRASLPTIQALAGRGARVVVCAHLGRPKGADPALSLRPVAARLGELLTTDVRFVPDTAGAVAGERARAAVGALGDGDVAVLENLRFEPGETSKDAAERAEFADRLSGLAECYVGDGFGAVHRKHASVYDVPARLPHAAGRLVRTEVEVLRTLTEHPARPYAVVLGGAKVSDKLGVIGNLIDRVDRLLVGGGMVFTFLKARGHEVGSSLLEEDQVPMVRELMAKAEARGVELVLPVDIVAATGYAADADHLVVPAEAIPADRMGLDIGPRSAALFADRLADAQTVFWNGPMGVFEFPAFAAGTRAVAEQLVAITATDGSEQAAFTVVGGGDSAAAVRALGLPEDRFSHISTGGGASLEYLEGKTLPGLAALEDD
jgi:phosphoglycerate kinase